MSRSASMPGERLAPPRPGGAIDGVAGVEQHGAALLHVGVDAVERVRRRLRRARHDRPVDQREEGELVAREVEADRLAGLERGALREEQRQALQAGLADVVDLGVAGDDIGEAGLRASTSSRTRRDALARRASGVGAARRVPASNAAPSSDAWRARRGGAAARRGRRRAARRSAHRAASSASAVDSSRAAQVVRLGIGDRSACRARRPAVSSGCEAVGAASVFTASSPSGGP